MDKKTQQETLLNCINVLNQCAFLVQDVEKIGGIKQALMMVHDALVAELDPSRRVENGGIH